MLKRILFIGIASIIFMSVLTGCVNVYSNDTYYVKIDGEGIKEGDSFQYTLKGFNEGGEEKTIQFTTNNDKPIEEGTYLKVTTNDDEPTKKGVQFKVTTDNDKETNKDNLNKISSIKGYEVIKSENVPEKVKEQLK